MKAILQIALICAGLSAAVVAALPQKTDIAPGPAFRDAAEDAMDCLDGLMLIDGESAQVFEPQHIKCMGEIRKIQRTASTPAEKSLADLIHSLLSSVRAERMTRGADQVEKSLKLRAQIILDGGLRLPPKPGL